jgi:quercetin dioxygenase-like cupin family protein
VDEVKRRTIMKTNHLRNKLALAVGLSIVILAGVIAYAATPNILAVGTIPHSELFDGPATVTVRTLTIGPGEVLQWHYHPGYAYNVVKSGELTVEEGCGGEVTLRPGDAFEELDGHVHRAKNLSATENVVVYNTFIVPQGKPTTVNIPNNERRCGPPSDANECKDDGWMTFNQPRGFSDQGDCVQYVRHRPRIVLPVPEDPQN